MVNLRHGDDEAVAGEQRGGAADGAGDLENLRVEQDAGILPFRSGAEDVGPHRASRRGEVGELGVFDDHEEDWEVQLGSQQFHCAGQLGVRVVEVRREADVVLARAVGAK